MEGQHPAAMRLQAPLSCKVSLNLSSHVSIQPQAGNKSTKEAPTGCVNFFSNFDQMMQCSYFLLLGRLCFTCSIFFFKNCDYF